MPVLSTEPQDDITPALDPADLDSLLLEQLRRCHKAAMRCFDIVEGLSIYVDIRKDLLSMASKMVSTSVTLHAALQKGSKEVRRDAPSAESKNEKTNSGGQELDSVDG